MTVSENNSPTNGALQQSKKKHKVSAEKILLEILHFLLTSKLEKFSLLEDKG